MHSSDKKSSPGGTGPTRWISARNSAKIWPNNGESSTKRRRFVYQLLFHSRMGNSTDGNAFCLFVHRRRRDTWLGNFKDGTKSGRDVPRT